ncbi:MAG: CPBP family intramembrane metalloprotease [Bacteroidetes bacterium]|nr:MAG: CPBP family intramembrane metalloprotease [Bacteroidota bacterium]
MTNSTPFGAWHDRPALVILLGLLGFVFFSGLGALLAGILTEAQGINVQELLSGGERTLSLGERNGLRYYNLVAHVLGFMISTALVILVVKQNQSWSRYAGLDRWPMRLSIGIGLLIVLVGFPFIQGVYYLNQLLPLPESMLSLESQQVWLVREILRMEAPSELGLALLVAAVAPALGEELLFRGLLQPRMQQVTGSAQLGIWLTAFLFSAIHLQFAGFLPRLLLGAFLGYAYWWSRTLWLSIILHFFYNGFQVLAAYFMPDDMQIEAVASEMNPWEVLPLAALSGLLMYGLLHYWRRVVVAEHTRE